VFRHVVVLKFREDTAAEEIDNLAVALREMPSAIESLRAYTVGVDIGLSDDSSDLIVIGDFDDQAGYEHYRDHPAHQAIIAEQIRPLLASRVAVQFVV